VGGRWPHIRAVSRGPGSSEIIGFNPAKMRQPWIIVIGRHRRFPRIQYLLREYSIHVSPRSALVAHRRRVIVSDIQSARPTNVLTLQQIRFRAGDDSLSNLNRTPQKALVLQYYSVVVARNFEAGR